MTAHDAIAAHIEREVRAEHARREAILVTAIMLTDPGHVHQLEQVEQDTGRLGERTWAVASRLERPPRPECGTCGAGNPWTGRPAGNHAWWCAQLETVDVEYPPELSGAGKHATSPTKRLRSAT